MKTTRTTGKKSAAQEAARESRHWPYLRMRATMVAIPFVSLVLGLPLWAAEQTETIAKEFKVPAGQMVRIVSPTGRLEIRGVDAGPVRIEAKKRARAVSEQDAREAVSKTRVEMTSDQKGLNVTTQLPRSLPWKRTSVWVDYSVTIPKDVGIEASLASGDVVVEGVRGAQQYNTASGDIRIRDEGPREPSDGKWGHQDGGDRGGGPSIDYQWRCADSRPHWSPQSGRDERRRGPQRLSREGRSGCRER